MWLRNGTADHIVIKGCTVDANVNGILGSLATQLTGVPQKRLYLQFAYGEQLSGDQVGRHYSTFVIQKDFGIQH